MEIIPKKWEEADEDEDNKDPFDDDSEDNEEGISDDKE